MKAEIRRYALWNGRQRWVVVGKGTGYATFSSKKVAEEFVRLMRSKGRVADLWDQAIGIGVEHDEQYRQRMIVNDMEHIKRFVQHLFNKED